MNHLLVWLAVALLLVAVVLLGILLHLRLHPKETIGSSSPAFRPDPNESAAIDQYLYDRCCRYMMEHRPFLVPFFSLQDLANAVFTNKLYLSKAIKILCYFLIVCVIIYIKLKSNDYLSMT